MIRKVKVSSNAFDKLDFLLPVTLTSLPDEFTVNDFVDLELPRILEIFSTEFDDLPVFEPQLPRYRRIVLTGVLIPKIVVYGFLHSNNDISLMDIELGLD